MDVKKIKELVEIIDNSSIDHFEYEMENEKIVLKKSATSFYDMTRHGAPTVDPVVTVEEIRNLPSEKTPVAEVDNVEGKQYILSPMVGTFYSSSAPGESPYVAVGDTIGEKTTVCIIEAMKLYNEIEAECRGVIAEVLVSNGELVEFGQPLFLVKKT